MREQALNNFMLSPWVMPSGADEENDGLAGLTSPQNNNKNSGAN